MNAPQTPEGALVADLALTPGLIRRAGMDGAPVGFDYTAALAFAPEGCSAADFAHLLRRAEAGLMVGFAKLAPP